MAGSLSRKRLGGALACVAVGLLGTVAPALAVAALLVAMLVAIIGSEHAAGRRRRQRGEPSPLQQVEAGAYKPRLAVRFAGVPRIEDYALLGDLQTAALVSRTGSIDWCCFPRFDSGACFAALLGDARPRALAARPVGGGAPLDAALPARHADPGVGVRDRRGQRARDRVHAAARDGAGHRADRGGPRRRRPHALRARDPVRLRQDRARGCAGSITPGWRSPGPTRSAFAPRSRSTART